MRYDDDRYLDEEEDKDFWDDELELSSDVAPRTVDDEPIFPRTSETEYNPYDSSHNDNHFENDEYAGNDDNHFENDVNTDNVDNDENEDNDYYSDPEPPVNSQRERLFMKKDEEADAEDDNDYYDSDEDPEPPKKSKTPKLDPEDPDYWIDEDESPLSGIISGPTRKWKWQLASVTGLLVLILWSWLWFFRPYSDNAVKYGYIAEMERRGSLFKTFEGTIIPYKQVGDPDPLYFQPIRFSVQTDSLAAVMKRMMLGCVPVRVEYETYHAPLPWKGEEPMVVIKADTADVSKILPPEFRYNK